MNDSAERTYPGSLAMQPAYSDTNDVTNAGMWRGIHYNDAAAVAPCAVSVMLNDDTNPHTICLQPGGFLPLSVKRVLATGTTAGAGKITLVR